MAAAKIDVTLDGLHQLHDRIGRRSLESQDYAVCGALVLNFTARYEARIARLKAKAAAAAAATAGSDDKVLDVEHSSLGDDDVERDRATEGEDQGMAAPHQDAGGVRAPPPPDQASAGDARTTPGAAPEPKTDSAGRTKPENPKGHGRNGASAYANAKHFLHTLMLGVIGSLCTCSDGRMRRYRERVTIRVVGQPLFAAEAHHYEQARCKMCGRIITAPGPDGILQGVGSMYVVYDWSACTMLIVMHYFGGAV